MFFMLMILFMDTLNQFIFVCSHVVTEMAISLHYLLTNERLEGFFFLHNNGFLPLHLACNLTTNIQILVNRSKSTYETFYR